MAKLRMAQSSTAKLTPLPASNRQMPALVPGNNQVKKFKRVKKYRSLAEIMATTSITKIEKKNVLKVVCQECRSGEKSEELLLCDKCHQRFHMDCVRPIVVRVPIGFWVCSTCSETPPVTSLSQNEIIEFFKIQKSAPTNFRCSLSPQDLKKRRRRTLVLYRKKKRRLLPYVPSENTARRLEQMRSLATALTALKIEFSNELTYLPGMAPRSANRAQYEDGGMQVLSKEDHDTLEFCRAMGKRGEFPPLLVTYDKVEGYTIEADGPIKHMTIIAENTGDVDYLENRAQDDCDSLMTLLLSTDPAKSLVICPDKRANISRFVNGINNHNPESKKKQNLKCVRYNVQGECCVLLVAKRDIAKGERLYYNYNGYENAYPTHHFV